MRQTRVGDRHSKAPTRRAAARCAASRDRSTESARGGQSGHTVLAAAAAVAAVSYLAFFSYVAGLQLGLHRGANAAKTQNALEPVRVELERQAAQLVADRQRAAGGIRALTQHVSHMQTRIVYMDALAARLSDAAKVTDAGFDFATDPPRGGPEELAVPGIAGYDAAVIDAAGLLSSQIEDRWRQLSVLEDFLAWRKLSDDVEPEGLPVATGYISSRFGHRLDPLTGRSALHKGIDFAGRPGTDVVAVAAGIVIFSGARSRYGQTVEIDHGNDRITRYAHNSENLVTIGDVVTRGQTIARLGNSGRTTGPNLHFEVLHAGEAVNPADYLR
jgi:murein DD-endopeptidase MepM/ murein hydrolase activator NlpD